MIVTTGRERFPTERPGVPGRDRVGITIHVGREHPHLVVSRVDVGVARLGVGMELMARRVTCHGFDGDFLVRTGRIHPDGAVMHPELVVGRVDVGVTRQRGTRRSSRLRCFTGRVRLRDRGRRSALP